MFKFAFSNIKLSFLALIVLTLLSVNYSCYASVNTTDNAEMVWVPGATFTMGNDWFEFPKHQVTLSGYWIYKYEVTVAKYRAFCTATGHTLPTFPTGYSWTNKSWTTAGLQQHPIVNVSWNDAKAYADWAKVSLPTEAQWEYAASGPAKNNYPWGGTAIIDDYYNGWDDLKCANYRNCEIKNISTKAVGSFPTGASWCGAQDMAGNVWEWCSDYWDLYNEVTTTNPTGPTTGDTRVLRGGSWSGDAEGSTRTTNRLNDSQGDFTPLFGFRCVSNTAGPLTAVTLAISPDTLSSVGTPITLTATPNGGSIGVQYKFMDGTNILQDFTTNKIFTWTPTNAGAATLTVVAKDTDTTTVTSSIVNITINPILSDVTLSALPVNSVGLGATVTLTATSTGGTTVQYKFMNGTNLLRDFTANNTYSWTPDTAGVTSLTVIATDGATTITSPVVNYTINPALTAVSLTTLPLNNIAFGLPVTLTATATGGTGVQYKFMNDNIMLRDFAVDNTFTWTPDTAGVINLTVVATDDNDTITSPAITITVNPALTAVSLSSSETAADVGTVIRLTATATGGTDVQYKFMNGNTILRDFTTDDILDWTPENVGEAIITVIAKDNSATLTSTAISITINPVLSAVALSTSPVNSVAFGLPITVTATPTGGTTVKYKFMIGNVVLRDVATDNSYTWTPAEAGTITLTVEASNDNVTVTSPEVTIIVNPALSAVSLLSSATAVDVGTTIKLTATATGGTNVQYKFMNGDTMLRDFTDDNIYNWTPLDTGNASITVIASDNSATISSTAVEITVNPVLSAVVLSTSPVNSVAFKLPITLTATATGGTNVKYKFMNGEIMLRDFATTNIYKWTPTVDGDMNLTVIASDDNFTVTSPEVIITVNPPLTAISLSLSANAIDLGKSVTLTATATGGGGGTNVKFMFMNVFNMLSNFTTDNTLIWTPATTGKYYLTVIASDSSTTISSTAVVLNVNPALTAVTLSSSATTVETGQLITLTATADGGTAVQFQFMNGDTILRDFAAGNTFAWTPATAGNYNLTVVASNINNTVNSDAVNIAVNLPLTAVSLQTSSAVINTGNPVTLTATATGGINVQYKFMNEDTILRDFTTDNTYIWTPITVGNASITVIASDINNTVTSLPIPITVNNNPILTAVLITSSPVNNVAIGTPVTLTATAVGGTNVQYKFMSDTYILRNFSSSNTYTFTPALLKTYNFTVIAKDLGGINPAATVTSSPVTLVNKPALSAISLKTSPSNATILGTPVTLTATATGGVDVHYKFMDGTAQLRDFEADNTFSFTPTEPKIYNFTVIVKDLSGIDPNATKTSATVQFTVNSALTDVSLTTTPLNTSALGTPVTLTATAIGGVNVQYQFLSDAYILRNFSSSNIYTFTPALLKTYNFTVIAKDLGGIDPTSTVTSSPVTLVNKPALSAVTLTADNTSPLAGSTVIFTATATGGASVQYQFLLDGNTTSPMRDFAAENTCQWIAVGGAHIITVVTRDVNGNPGTIVNKTLTVKVALTSVSMSTTPINTAALGTPVTLNATAIGGVNVQYQFMTGTTILRSFSSSNTYTFTPALIKTYNFTVLAKDLGGVNPTTIVTSSPVTLVNKPVLSAVTVTADNTSPWAGSTVTFTATATGGASVQYQFLLDGNTTSPLRDFAAENTCQWIAVGGTHIITVVVRDTNGNPGTTVTVNKTLTVKVALTSVSMSTTPLNTATLGIPVTLNATATGGVNVQYQFMIGTTILRSFNSSNTYTFTPALLKTYSFTVIAKDLGGINPNTTFTSAITNYVVTAP